ncbi:hypothetical protein DFS33DRAFT_1289773 [Desarmillaria ectypa]|nr:hypothetical protein DFS33DRAFT_1289773 [Desarmillaria ectypa]
MMIDAETVWVGARLLIPECFLNFGMHRQKRHLPRNCDSMMLPFRKWYLDTAFRDKIQVTPIHLSSLCSRWRTIVLASPDFWSAIFIGRWRDNKIIGAHLAHSGRSARPERRELYDEQVLLIHRLMHGACCSVALVRRRHLLLRISLNGSKRADWIYLCSNL